MSNHVQEDQCFSIFDVFEQKKKHDGGFSGVLHATTGILTVLLFFLVSLWLGFGKEYFVWGNIALILGFSGAWIGSTLYNDLDNSKSTSHSALGFIGEALSVLFRSSSVFMQTVVRTSKDDANPNPHRGFWHTPFSAILLGVGIWALRFLTKKFNIPFIGPMELGDILTFLIFAAMIHLFFSGLMKRTMAKFKKSPIGGELIAFLFSMSIAGVLYHFIDTGDMGNLWLAIAVAGGGITHILGDGFTKYGVPLLFPICVFFKGRFWWYSRFAKIQSGNKEQEATVTLIVLGLSVLALVGLVFLLLA